MIDSLQTTITANREGRLVRPSDHEQNPDPQDLSDWGLLRGQLRPNSPGTPFQGGDRDTGHCSSTADEGELEKVIIWCNGDYRRLRGQINGFLRTATMWRTTMRVRRVTRNNETRFEIPCASHEEARQLAQRAREAKNFQLRDAGTITVGRTWRMREGDRGNTQQPELRGGKSLVMAVNASGINPGSLNLQNLNAVIRRHSPDVVGISETWLQDKHDIRFPDYTAYFSSRESQTVGGRGSGGVALLIHKQWDYRVGRILTYKAYSDMIFVRGTTTRGRKLAIGCFYGPQERVALDKRKEIWERLDRTVRELQANDYELILLGDFNAWLGDPVPGEETLGKYINPTNRRQNANGELLLNLLERHSLLCLNGRIEKENMEEHCTYLGKRDEDKGSVLDLVVCSTELGTDRSADTIEGMSFDGHRAVAALIDTGGRRRLERTTSRKQFNTHLLWSENRFSALEETEPAQEGDASVPDIAIPRLPGERAANAAANMGEDYRSRLSAAMDNVLEPITRRAQAMASDLNTSRQEIEDIWTQWTTVVYAAATEVLGFKKRFKHKDPAWNEQLQQLRNEVTEIEASVRAEGGWTSARRRESWTIRREMRQLLSRERAKAKERLHSQCEEDRVQRPRTFWKTVKRICGERTREYELRTGNDGTDGTELTSTPEERAAVLREHYDALGNKPAPSGDSNEEHHMRVLVELAHLERTTSDRDFIFTIDKVELALEQCKLDKASGPDGLPVEILKFGGEAMTRCLVALFNMCNKLEMMPMQFKQCHIYSLWKKRDSPHDARNYRGISLLNTVGKVFVRVLAAEVSHDVDGKLRDEQAGFRPERSTEDQIIILKDTIDESNATKKQLNVVFVDFKAAYDRVWREGLWYKMYKIGVNPKHIRLFKELYSTVEVKALSGSVLSEPFNISIGVRQGCVASPTLFDIYVNDLIEDLGQRPVEHQISTWTGRHFNSLMFADDLLMVTRADAESQQQLDIVDSWCAKWKATAHPDKTKVMRVNGAQPTVLTYRGNRIEEVDHYKYLGLIFQADGTWTMDHQRRVDKGERVTKGLLAVLTSKYLPARTKELVWNAKARPVMEYGSAVFHPHRSKWTSLDSVQHQALCKCLGVNRYSAKVGVRGELGARSMRGRMEILLLRTKARINGKTRHDRMPLLDDTVSNAELSRVGGFRANWRFLWIRIVKHHGEERAQALFQTLQDAGSDEDITAAADAIMNPIEIKRNRKDREKKSTISEMRKTVDDMQPEPHTKWKDTVRGRLMGKIRTGMLPLEWLKKKQKPAESDGICKLCEQDTETLKHFLLECEKLDRSGIPEAFRTFEHLTGGTTPKEQVLASHHVQSLWNQRLSIRYPVVTENGVGTDRGQTSDQSESSRDTAATGQQVTEGQEAGRARTFLERFLNYSRVSPAGIRRRDSRGVNGPDNGPTA
eukprot:TRINITY_DN967_c0_g1_i1.p1 TRINITY_DN967_c0_g1~~TRINITY_DN967_c0_g1_i1.p1  ORF type:complete len:1425 (-),score=122.70 TRINITY_DN967_c0_g1_i1:951-5225(-)